MVEISRQALGYNVAMDFVSPEIAREIERRLAAGPHVSVDALLKDALRALDAAEAVAENLLEKEILRGLQGEDAEMTAADWDEIEREALKAIEAKKAR